MRRFEKRMSTGHAKQIYRQRARVAEFPHAWIKSKCGLGQFRCRTRPTVACEVLFAALTCNLRRYAKLSSFISRQVEPARPIAALSELDSTKASTGFFEATRSYLLAAGHFFHGFWITEGLPLMQVESRDRLLKLFFLL
jgi:Transposase DDE domain